MTWFFYLASHSLQCNSVDFLSPGTMQLFRGGMPSSPQCPHVKLLSSRCYCWEGPWVFGRKSFVEGSSVTEGCSWGDCEAPAPSIFLLASWWMTWVVCSHLCSLPLTLGAPIRGSKWWGLLILYRNVPNLQPNQFFNLYKIILLGIFSQCLKPAQFWHSEWSLFWR